MINRNLPNFWQILSLVALLTLALFFMKIRSLEDFIRTTSQNTQPVFPSLQPEYFLARNIIQHPSTDRFEASRQIIVNVGILDSDITLLHEFSKLVELKVEDTDTRLIKLTRNMIDPPTMHITKFSKPAVKTPQATEIDQLLKLKGGFFVECGALDGERSSNSIWLEKFKNWSGLLIEMDPYFYTQLRGKNRHSYSINACLSTSRHPEMIYFKESDRGEGKLVDPNETVPLKDLKEIRRTPCIPMTTMMLALNQTRIDFLSLDVEGFELPILKTFRWDQINIRAIAVEYSHSHKGELRKYIESQGYKLSKDIHFRNYQDYLGVDDFIFLKTV